MGGGRALEDRRSGDGRVLEGRAGVWETGAFWRAGVSATGVVEGRRLGDGRALWDRSLDDGWGLEACKAKLGGGRGQHDVVVKVVKAYRYPIIVL